MAERSKPGGKPTRLWVPGLLYLSDELELLTGADVGFNGWGKAFAASPCGHFGSLTDMHHTAWLLERSYLTEALIDEHAIIVPERLLDAERQPCARRWLAEQPLLCVSGAKVQRLADAGLRVYLVEHGVDREWPLRIEAYGGGRAGWWFRARVSDLWPPEIYSPGSSPEGSSRARRKEGGAPPAEEPAVRLAVDRALRALSRGVLGERAVLNALAARMLVEPGYGYYGATDGVAASIERVERELRALEALFAQVYARAEGQRSDAIAILEALEQVDGRSENLALPVYTRARRVRMAELSIPLVSDEATGGPMWVSGDQPRKELVLPEESSWVVEDADLWSPALPPELAHELGRARAKPPLPSASFAVAMLALLVLIIALALWRLS